MPHSTDSDRPATLESETRLRIDSEICPRGAPVPLSVPLMIDAGACWRKARTTRLSVEGVRLNRDNAIAEGTAVEIYFELPTGVGVEAVGTLRHDGSDTVIMFRDLGAAELAVRAFCRARRRHLRAVG